jgi:hypothetical protein
VSSVRSYGGGFLKKCDVDNPKVIWEVVVEWESAELRGKSLLVILCKLALGAVVYHIWKHRNDVRHGNVLKSEEQILKIIVWEIMTRIMGIGKFKRCEINEKICGR